MPYKFISERRKRKMVIFTRGAISEKVKGLSVI